jgi:subtilisin family serine protease
VVESSDPDAAAAAVEAAGGTVTESVGNVVQAEVPADRLAAMAEAPDVDLVRPPQPARPFVTSEGVTESGATAWHTDGLNGAGVTVAIVDGGFDNYAALLGTELPATVETDFSRCSGTGGSNHGTAVAEVVHDQAPGATLRLVCIDTDIEFVAALGTLDAAGVDVVNGSIGFTLTGRGDGSGGAATPAGAVAALRRQGVLYVAAAGNYNGTHFHTPAIGDAPGNDAADHVNISPDDVLQFNVAPGGTVDISIKWDAWPTTRQDFDVYVGNDLCGLVGASTVDQAGAPSPLPPIEYVTFTNCSASTQTFELLVDRFSGTGTPRLDFFFDGDVGGLEHFSGSALPEPMSSPAAFTVGAHCASNGAPEPYSSRGPTIDGRIKPDISGPDATSSSVYGAASGCAVGFRGTSAAAPHVAGAAALLLQANPALDVAELQQLLEDRAIDTAPAGKDIVSGAGRLRLGTAGDVSTPTPQAFHGLTPVRLFDSRPNLTGVAESGFGPQGRTTPISAGGQVAVPVTGVAGVPADATAVVLNVTVTAPTSPGWLTVFPSGTVPVSSNLNFVPGQTVAVHVTATVGPDGKVRFFNSHGNTHVVVDIAGWYGPTGAGAALFTPLAAPARAIDTRPGTAGFAEAGFGPNGRTAPLSQGAAIDVPLAGLGGVPADATAVMLNVTVTGPTAAGWITVFPTGAGAPQASTVNFAPNQTVANLVVVPVGTNGQVRFANALGNTHVIVDVVGSYRPGGGAGYIALDPPTRDLDTRTGNGPRLGALGHNETFLLEVGRYYGVPADAAAVLLSVTAITPTSAGWLTVYPGTAPRPLASNLNFVAGGGVVVPNAVVSALGTNGTIAIHNPSGFVNVVSDLAGYFLA